VDVHRIEVRQRDVPERGGEAAGVIELRVAGLRILHPSHRVTRIHQETHRKVALLFIELHEKPFEPPVRRPVNRAQFVAGRVLAVVGKLQTAARLPVPALGAVLAAEKPLRQQMKPLKFRQKGGVK
jgi:hypothetical protein